MTKDKDTTILIISGVRGDTRRYRALHLSEQLRLCNIDSMFSHASNPALLKVLDRPWDLVVLHRVPYNSRMVKPLERLRKKRTILLSDFDDLIFDPAAFQFINSPDFTDPIRKKDYVQTMQRIRDMLEQSDGMLASTNFLADQIRKTSEKPVWVHRNAFSLEMLKLSNEARETGPRRTSQRVLIGYASGTPTHNQDFALIRTALQKILTRYAQVDLQLIGPLDPGDGWDRFGERIKRQKLVPWRQLPALLAALDINLAPLVTDNPFAQSKSEIKYMEAGMVGVATVASPTDAFCYAIRSGENGLLAETEEEWVAAISGLVEDGGLRQKMGETARNVVISAYHPVVRAGDLAGRLEEIGQTFRSGWFGNNLPLTDEIQNRAQQVYIEKDWIPEMYEKGPSNIQMGLFSLRTVGLAETLGRVWIFFRRLLAPLLPFRKP